MNLKEFHALIDEHIVHAKEKHPLFAHMLTHDAAWIYDAHAKREKRIIQTDVRMNACAATTVVSAELYEFFAELASGNLDRAKEEAADLVATIYRALEMLEDKKGGQE